MAAVTDIDEIFNCQICNEPYDEKIKIPMLLKDCMYILVGIFEIKIN